MPRILFVDDNKEFLDIASLTLKKVGYDVVTADNGTEAINKFNESSFDAVVTDLVMPGTNGYELAMHIRKTAKSGAMPAIICITGSSCEINLSCFDFFLEKPFSIKKLVEYLEDFDKKRRK